MSLLTKIHKNILCRHVHAHCLKKKTRHVYAWRPCTYICMSPFGMRVSSTAKILELLVLFTRVQISHCKLFSIYILSFLYFIFLALWCKVYVPTWSGIIDISIDSYTDNMLTTYQHILDTILILYQHVADICIKNPSPC